MESIALNETMERIQGKRAHEKKEQENEDLVLLLITIEEGVLLFSYPFSDK